MIIANEQERSIPGIIYDPSNNTKRHNVVSFYNWYLWADLLSSKWVVMSLIRGREEY